MTVVSLGERRGTEPHRCEACGQPFRPEDGPWSQDEANGNDYCQPCTALAMQHSEREGDSNG